MTEEQIERQVERMTNALDARFMADNNTMTQAEYDAESKKIGEWADAEFSRATRS